MNTREKFISKAIEAQGKDCELSSFPTADELLSYVRLNIKRKRLQKKFLKNPMFYRLRLPKKIVNEYISKHLACSMQKFVWNTLNRESFARRVFCVKPLVMDNQVALCNIS